MDFSGYVDMAIGLALILGVNLPINFNNPYGANSLIDFWRRWHITLSSWLKDYLYIPLGGNKFGYILQTRNIFITMLIGEFGMELVGIFNMGLFARTILCITHLYLKLNFTNFYS